MARPEQRLRLRGDAGQGHGTEWGELIQAARLCRKPEEVLGLSQLLGDSANDFCCIPGPRVEARGVCEDLTERPGVWGLTFPCPWGDCWVSSPSSCWKLPLSPLSPACLLCFLLQP